MCVIYHMIYEFNNWKEFFKLKRFVTYRHPNNSPTYSIKVPIAISGESWLSLDGTVAILRPYVPDNLEEMSIYGTIRFEVTKDENLNQDKHRNRLHP